MASEESRGSAQVDVSALINGAPFGAYQRRVVVLCGFIAMLDGFDAQAIGFVAPIIAGLWNIPRDALGPLFAAGLLGLMVGALLLGAAADRFGRKPIIIFSTVVMGLFSCLSTQADSVEALIVLRFLTGLGLGGALPNITALASEYSPDRMRATVVTLVLAGFPFGAVIGGYVSALMIPVFGWESVFLLGGVLPLLLALLLIRYLSESTRFLVQSARPDRAKSILNRIVPAGEWNSSDVLVLREERLIGSSVKHLFSNDRFFQTLLIWTAFFMNLLMIYFVVNWLPYLAQRSGSSIRTAVLLVVMFNAGGVIGSVVLGWLIDRHGAPRVLSVTYLIAAALIAAIGLSERSPSALMVVVSVAGFCVIGAQIGIYALAAVVYPTSIRATGVGWAVGIGRLGSIAGPLAGGALLAANWSFAALFAVACVPAVIASIAVFQLRERDGSTHRSPAGIGGS